MGYVNFNKNNKKKLVGDCVIRAIATLLDVDWDDVYLDITTKGFYMKDMPSSNEVWSSYLRDVGFERYVIPNSCPDCYTVKDFCIDNPQGQFLLATGSHVIAVIDGSYYDTWDSGNEVPIYYWQRRN